MYLGKFSNLDCSTSKSAINQSLLITGASGSGKTCRMQQIELSLAKNNTTVVVLDMGYSHTHTQIMESLRTEYETYTNRLQVIRNGIDLPVFNTVPDDVIHQKQVVNNITQIIANSTRLRQRQTMVLRKAIESAYYNYHDDENSINVIGKHLLEMGSAGEELYDKLWFLFQSNVIKQNDYIIRKGNINIIDMSNINPITQKIVVELFLRCLWMTRDINNLDVEYAVCLDECQNLYLRDDSIVCQMLREGRKFHINLLLTTQSLTQFSPNIRSLLEQTGTHLYFQPSATDLNYIAKSLLQSCGSNQKQCLARLEVGESLAYGDLMVDGNKIMRPIILT